ncbi:MULTISPECIES: pseudouridine synthase [Brevibacterium]|jgi:23S rRNA pseudouridine2605 synthase|uniref:Pseudouridine synthase n=1 Tax=Brevibacterium salitolerans TaxID=1403566 RepID=A0ABN2X9J1_9MICO|nr:pseudouridine synthase [Brevibacterium sp.]
MNSHDPRSPGHRSKRPTRRARAGRKPVQTGHGPVSDVHSADGVRLQKVLADAGLGSRRACEQLISEGRVEVDGVVVTELGTRIDPEKQTVHVDTLRITAHTDKVYLAFNKPKKVLTSMSDPEGRKTVADYLKNRPERLFYVGRLDYETEGLLLLTNDGELSNRLTHPRYEVPKTYLAQVRGPVPKDAGARLRDGIELEDGMAHVDSFRLLDSTPGRALVEVVLHSGRNRIVRRLLEAVGTPVERLVRTQFGPIALAEQRPGKMRDLRPHEVGELMKAVDL